MARLGSASLSSVSQGLLHPLSRTRHVGACRCHGSQFTVAAKMQSSRVGFSKFAARAIALGSEDNNLEGVPSSSEDKSPEFDLCCPICQDALLKNGPSGISRYSLLASTLKCRRCQRTFSTTNGVADLTVASETSNFEERQLPGTFIFQNPLVAYVYERGWRQGFSYAGFPGVEEEFKMAQEFFEPAKGGKEPLLDVSCGSGLFSRRFLSSGDYPLVIASDFSSSMLAQCQSFLEEDRNLDLSKISLVRADVARLPFSTGSISAVHAGAAIHCWPQPASAVAEISRVLKPGGVFVGTTFLLPQIPQLGDLLKPFQQLTLQGPFDPYRWWTDKELKDLTVSCGLVEYRSIVKQSFVIFTARKPELEE